MRWRIGAAEHAGVHAFVRVWAQEGVYAGGACAWCQGQPKRRPRVAVARCRKPAMAELRRWNTGDGVPAPAVDYGS